MFKDIIEILEFTLNSVKNKQVKEHTCMEIYDLYRHLHTTRKSMNILISFMEQDWRDYNDMVLA